MKNAEQLAREYSAALKGLAAHACRKKFPVGIMYIIFIPFNPDRRDALKAFLQEEGISTGLHYPIALHLLPALKSSGTPRKRFSAKRTPGQTNAESASLSFYELR